MAALAVVGALILDWYVVEPILDSGKQREAEKQALVKQLTDAQTLVKRGEQLKPKWRDMEKGGLKTDPSEAESAVLRAVDEWAKDAQFSLTARKPERVPGKGDLREISYQITGSGRTAAVAKFLYRADTTTLPVKVEEVAITARREGTDDLSVQIRLNGIYVLPAAEAAAEAARKAGKTAPKGETK